MKISYKNIRISEETYRKLSEKGSFGETYDKIVKRLISISDELNRRGNEI
jgi:hypothetical protein